MTTTRRLLTLAGLVLAVIIGSTIPASATFTDAAAVTTTVGTASVEPAHHLKLIDYCVTATTTTRRTVSTDPATGVQTLTAYSSSTTSATSTSNEQSSTSSTVSGPGVNETTTTTVSKNTTLHVTLSWTASTSPGVIGYQVTAVAPNIGVRAVVASTTGTSVSQAQDADVLAYQPRLYVTTQTAYGWTADSGRTARLGC